MVRVWLPGLLCFRVRLPARRDRRATPSHRVAAHLCLAPPLRAPPPPDMRKALPRDPDKLSMVPRNPLKISADDLYITQ